MSSSGRRARPSPGAPRGGGARPKQLRDRVSFFEQLSSSRDKCSSSEDLVDDGGGGGTRRSSSRASSSSFEESFERLVEEGECAGPAKVLKFERITVKRSVREVTAEALRCEDHWGWMQVYVGWYLRGESLSCVVVNSRWFGLMLDERYWNICEWHLVG